MPGSKSRIFYINEKRYNLSPNPDRQSIDKYGFYILENGVWYRAAKFRADQSELSEDPGALSYTPIEREKVASEAAIEILNEVALRLETGSEDRGVLESANYGEVELTSAGTIENILLKAPLDSRGPSNHPYPQRFEYALTRISEMTPRLNELADADRQSNIAWQKELHEEFIKNRPEPPEDADQKKLYEETIEGYKNEIDRLEKLSKSDILLDWVEKNDVTATKALQESVRVRDAARVRENSVCESIVKNRDALILENRMEKNTDESRDHEIVRKMMSALAPGSLKIYKDGALHRLGSLETGETYRGGELETGFGSDMFAAFLSAEDKKLLLKGEAEHPECPYGELLTSLFPDDPEKGKKTVDDINAFTAGVSQALYKFQSRFYESLKSPDPTKEVRECYAELLTDLSGLSEEHSGLFALLQSSDERKRKVAAAALTNAWEISMADYRSRINEDIRNLNPEQLRKLAIMDRNMSKEHFKDMTSTLKGMFLSDNFETAYGTAILSMACPMFAAVIAFPFIICALVSLGEWLDADKKEQKANLDEQRIREYINVMSKTVSGQAMYIDLIKGGLAGRIDDVLDKAASPEGIASYYAKGQALRAAMEPIMMSSFEKEITVGSKEDTELRQSMAYVYGKFFEDSGALSPDFIKKMTTMSERIVAENAIDIDGNVRVPYREHEEAFSKVFSMDEGNGLTEDLRKTLTDYKTCLSEVAQFEKEHQVNVQDALLGMVDAGSSDSDKPSLDDPKFCKELLGLIGKYQSPGLYRTDQGSCHGAYHVPYAVARSAIDLMKWSRDEDGVDTALSGNVAEINDMPFGDPEASFENRDIKNRNTVCGDLGLRLLAGNVPTADRLNMLPGYTEQLDELKGLGLVCQVLEAVSYDPENPDPKVNPDSNVFLRNNKAAELKEPGVAQMLVQVGLLESYNDLLQKDMNTVVREQEEKLRGKGHGWEDSKVSMTAAKALLMHNMARAASSIYRVTSAEDKSLYKKAQSLLQGTNKGRLMDQNFKDADFGAKVASALESFDKTATEHFQKLSGEEDWDADSLVAVGSEGSLAAAAASAYGILGGDRLLEKIEELEAAEARRENEQSREDDDWPDPDPDEEEYDR